MRSLGVLLTALFIGLAVPAKAGIVVNVDNSQQRMRVYVDGMLAYVWPVSTARKGYRTPPGNYRVQRMERMWYSRKYDMSPMPYSLFFRAPARSASSVGRRATAACACIPLTPGPCSGWCGITAALASS